MGDDAQNHGQRGDLNDPTRSEEIGLLDDGEHEDDRCQAAGAEPAGKGGGRPRRSGAEERQRDRHHSHDRQAQQGVGDRGEVEVDDSTPDDDRPENEEGDGAEEAAELLHELGRFVGAFVPRSLP